MNKYIPTKLDRAEDQACNFNEDDFVVPSELARQLEDACKELAEALDKIAFHDCDDTFYALENCQQIAADALAKWKEANK